MSPSDEADQPMFSFFKKKSPPLVRTVIFEATEHCNNGCLYCYNFKREAPGFDHEETVRVLDALLEQTHLPDITFSGGEPFVRGDIVDLFRHVKKKGARPSVITNGTLLTEELIKESMKAGVRSFQLPLLTCRPEVHKALTGSGAYAGILGRISFLREKGAAVPVVFVATALNVEELENVLKLALVLDASYFMFNLFNPGGFGHRNMRTLLPSLEQLNRALALIQRVHKDYPFRIGLGTVIPPCIVDRTLYPDIHFPTCSAGTKDAYYAVTEHGDVRMCNHSPRVVGNILREDFSAIAASAKAGEFLGAFPGNCKDCSLLEKCRGGCKASSESCEGCICADLPLCKAYNITKYKEVS